MVRGAILFLWACLSACAATGCGRRAPKPAPPGEAAAREEEAPAPVSRVEREGLSIAFTLRPADPREGAAAAFGDAIAELTITDAETGAPVRGLMPLGWMSRRGEGGAPDEGACRAKVKSFMAGLLSARAEVDLNRFLLWTLNEDGTLSAIDPQVAFSRTKLLHVVTLAGRGISFALHPEHESLYVTLGGGRGLAIVDTRRGLVRRNVPVGAEPARVVISPDGRAVWVGNDGDGTVSVLDARSGDARATLRVGPGHHEFAFASGGRAAWITSSGGDSVAVFDTETLESIGEVAVGAGAASIAASDVAGAVHVARGARGEVVFIDSARRAVAGRAALRPGLSAIRFDPGGRFAFALNPGAGEVSLIDAATGAVAHTLAGLPGPDEVTFTDAFAYLHHRDAGRISLVDRAAMGRASPPPVVHVEVGQRAPSAPPRGAFAAPIAPAPDGRSVFVANPADRAIYHYVEGMMAPIGTLSGQGRVPRSVLVEDRSLEEVRPGVYAAAARLGAEGVHDVEILLDDPRVAVCLEATVAPRPPSVPAGSGEPDEQRLDPKIKFTPLFDPALWLEAGEPATLRFRVEAEPGAPPVEAREMEIMILRFPAGYRWTGAPRAEADGAFSVTFTPPIPGQYRLLFADEGRGAPPGALPEIPLRVFEGPRAKGGAQ